MAGGSLPIEESPSTGYSKYGASCIGMDRTVAGNTRPPRGAR